MIFGTPGFIWSHKEPHSQIGPPPEGQGHLSDCYHDWIRSDVSNIYANFRHPSHCPDGHILLENSLIQQPNSLKFQCPQWQYSHRDVHVSIIWPPKSLLVRTSKKRRKKKKPEFSEQKSKKKAWHFQLHHELTEHYRKQNSHALPHAVPCDQCN